MFLRIAVLLGATAASGWAAAPEYRAGVASVDITPSAPIRLSGYGSRSQPASEVVSRLFARALVIQHGSGAAQTIVIVTTDVIGLTRAITDVVAVRAMKEHGLDRGALLFNSSHTHTGPYIRGNLPLLFEMNDAEREAVNAYAERLTGQLTQIIESAFSDLGPANLSLSHGAAHFAVNRRERSGDTIKLGVNPPGATDPDVPVLRITGKDGKVRAVLFGYACHNTTLGGEHNFISGDYAGYAQQLVEKAMPGTVAMFVMLCGGDQNPNPRGIQEAVARHGQELGSEVLRCLKGTMLPVRGRIRSALEVVDLDVQTVDREEFESRLNDRNMARVRHARAMLERLKRGDPTRHYPYPVQAISFGKSLTLLALGGEVVVDYCLRVKREYPGRNVIVAGYSNDVMAYIPSRRMLDEGGYEVLDSMYYYGLPSPWAADTEERIMKTIGSVMARVR